MQANAAALIVTAPAFYLSSLLITDIGSAMSISLVITPLVCLDVGVYQGARYGFHWLYPVIVAVLFVPCVFLLFNDSALIYAPVYGVIAALGCGVGAIFFASRHRKESCFYPCRKFVLQQIGFR